MAKNLPITPDGIATALRTAVPGPGERTPGTGAGPNGRTPGNGARAGASGFLLPGATVSAISSMCSSISSDIVEAGLDDIALTLQLEDKIAAYEAERLATKPWLAHTL